MAKKQGGENSRKQFRLVNSVTVGPCNMGMVTVTANVTFLANAEARFVFLSIVRASDSVPVAGPIAMTSIGGDNYSASIGVVGPGPFKAKVDATWKDPASHSKVSSQFNCTVPPGPTPMGASGSDECCQ